MLLLLMQLLLLLATTPVLTLPFWQADNADKAQEDLRSRNALECDRSLN